MRAYWKSKTEIFVYDIVLDIVYDVVYHIVYNALLYDIVCDILHNILLYDIVYDIVCYIVYDIFCTDYLSKTFFMLINTCPAFVGRLWADGVAEGKILTSIC